MIPFIIYTLIFGWLIYKNRFFGLFNDNVLSGKHLVFTFGLKILAVPAFYLFFKIAYGGIEKLDAGKFFFDSVVINHLAYENFGEYVKMLFGLQDDSPGSYFFKHCIDTTNNWENGQVKDFFYNDNRIVIRVHSLLHFISFGSYFCHALFECFFSFIGLFFVYKTFKEYFPGKEVWLFFVIALFPTLWLYTGGLLKEGITMLVLGILLFHLKGFIGGKRTTNIVLSLLFLLFVSILLKPYILFYGACVFTLCFLIEKSQLKYKTPAYFISIFLLVVLANLTCMLVKKRSFLQAAEKREMEFRDLSTGGIFLLDSAKFVRVPYDTTLVTRVKGKPNYYTIKNGVPYTYWEHTHQQDTLYCKANTDAASTYSLVYILPKAGSAIDVVNGSRNYFVIAGRCLYYTIVHPFFVNAKGIMQQFASLENLVLILCIVMTLGGFVFNPKQLFPAAVFLFYGLSLFMLIGLTTPNSGAIMRYRAPAAIFILMSALCSYCHLKIKTRKS